jgi:hypothetical protein
MKYDLTHIKAKEEHNNRRNTTKDDEVDRDYEMDSKVNLRLDISPST